jgi:hypothetical protein
MSNYKKKLSFSDLRKPRRTSDIIFAVPHEIRTGLSPRRYLTQPTQTANHDKLDRNTPFEKYRLRYRVIVK